MALVTASAIGLGGQTILAPSAMEAPCCSRPATISHLWTGLVRVDPTNPPYPIANPA